MRQSTERRDRVREAPFRTEVQQTRLPHTLHHELIRRAGIHVTSAEQIITAGVAEPLVASRLKIDVGSPLLSSEPVFFDDRSRPVGYLEVLASPSMFELHTLLGPMIGGAG